MQGSDSKIVRAAIWEQFWWDNSGKCIAMLCRPYCPTFLSKSLFLLVYENSARGAININSLQVFR